MVKNKNRSYTIVWHFEGTTLTSTYINEETRDKAFEEMKEYLDKGIKFHSMGDTILNADKVICITKGEDDGWTFRHVN